MYVLKCDLWLAQFKKFEYHISYLIESIWNIKINSYQLTLNKLQTCPDIIFCVLNTNAGFQIDIQKMLPCGLLLPGWPTMYRAHGYNRLEQCARGCDGIQGSDPSPPIRQTRRWTACRWRHRLQQRVRSHPNRIHARWVPLWALPASGQSSQEQIPEHHRLWVGVVLWSGLGYYNIGFNPEVWKNPKCGFLWKI